MAGVLPYVHSLVGWQYGVGACAQKHKAIWTAPGTIVSQWARRISKHHIDSLCARSGITPGPLRYHTGIAPGSLRDRPWDSLYSHSCIGAQRTRRSSQGHIKIMR